MKNAINRYSLSELQTFSVLAKELNFANTGHILNLSSSSVSRQVANLEQALGVTLFTRNTRKVVLTEAGDALYQMVNPMLSELSGLGDRLQELRSEVHGLVRIAAPRWYSSHYLAPVLPSIQQSYPGLKFEILTSDQLLDPILSDADVFIRFNGVSHPDIVARKLIKYEYWLVASPQFLKAHDTISNPSDLPQQHLLAYRFSEPHNQWIFKQARRTHRVPLKQAGVSSDNPEVLLNTALNHGGIALLPNIGVSDHVESKQLIRLLPEFAATPSGFDNGVYLVYTKDKAHLQRVRTVIDCLIEKLSEAEQ